MPRPDSTKVGVMLDSGRLRGSMKFAPAPTSSHWFGAALRLAKSSISLLSSTPVPGTTSPVPNQPFSVMVPETRLPSASRTAK